MMRDILDTITELSPREWLAILSEFVGMCFVVASIALICIGFAPEVTP